MMHIFIVGGTGAIGRALVPLLRSRGHALRLLARDPDRARRRFGDAAEIVIGDLLAVDPPTLAAQMSGCDAAVHVATAIPRDFAAPGAWDLNTRLRTDGTRRLLGAALAADVRRYVQESVAMAYPDGGDRWLDESTPLDDTPERAAICGPVIAMEGLVRAVPPDRLAWHILRAGRLVGPGTFQEGLVAELRAGTATVAGDGSNWISPVHVADMAGAIALALESDGGGATLNIADEPIREGEYEDRLASLFGAPPPRRDPDRPMQPSCRCTSAAARARLGWEPTHGIWPADIGS
jgi:nucleoside-diphosphate-sugar epimerase